MNNNKVVLFVDILGFAALTEAHPIDPDTLARYDRPLSWNVDSIANTKNVDTLDNINTLMENMGKFMEPFRNPLTHTFASFHSSLRAILSLANMKHPLTAITFSDSAFIATTYTFEAVNIGVSLVQSLLPQKVPVRIGIAYGSFAALRFKSDISSDSGDHLSQFLGTAVVRAHSAETCGIKGIRILLHPSVMPLLDDGAHNPESKFGFEPICHLECPESEKSNSVAVHYEINYWPAAVTKAATAWRGIQEMWTQSPESEVVHYEATAAAVNRMRIMKGHKPIDKLRRRTLPV